MHERRTRSRARKIPTVSQATYKVADWLCAVTSIAAALLMAGAAVAQTEEAESAQPSTPEYSRAGADTCLSCHDESSEFPVLAIFKTRHALGSDSRTPFANLQCVSCHGPGA